MKILHLIDSFDCDSSTRQLQLLAPKSTPGDRVEICCLGPDTGALQSMRQAGVIVHALRGLLGDRQRGRIFAR